VIHSAVRTVIFREVLDVNHTSLLVIMGWNLPFLVLNTLKFQ
jgi:hypothetical protein